MNSSKHQTSGPCKRESRETLTLLWPQGFLHEWRRKGSMIYLSNLSWEEDNIKLGDLELG